MCAEKKRLKLNFPTRIFQHLLTFIHLRVFFPLLFTTEIHFKLKIMKKRNNVITRGIDKSFKSGRLKKDVINTVAFRV